MKKLWKFLKKHGAVFAKGAAVGATLRVPGMSGGTTAIILRIYDRLLSAVNNFFKNVKENLLFLGVFAVGGGAAFFAFNSLVYGLTSAYPAASAYFFAGIILFGIPALLKEGGITYKSTKTFEDVPKTPKNSTIPKKNIFNAVLGDLLPFAAGAAVVAIISLVQGCGAMDASGLSGVGRAAFNAAAGFFAGVALVLPGVSFTYFLTVIGLMDILSLSLSFLTPADAIFLLTFGAGAFIGLIASAKALDGLIKKHKRGTYACVTGFLAGSVIMLLTNPEFFPKKGEIFFCIAFFAAGGALVCVLTRLSAAIFSFKQ